MKVIFYEGYGSLEVNIGSEQMDIIPRVGECIILRNGLRYIVKSILHLVQFSEVNITLQEL